MNEIVSEYYERSWGDAAHLILTRTARTYAATLQPRELGVLVQEETGLRTNIPSRHWINRVLLLVVLQCRDLGEPPLTSLVVGRDGTVGPAYEAVFQIHGLPVPGSAEAREHQAAEMRLECYRWAGADIPERTTGASLRRTPSPRTPRPPTVRVPTTRVRKPEPPPAQLCPTCFMELPVTGQCDNCA